jgi:mRNA interferase HigB
MNVIAKKTLRDFWEGGHANARAPMQTWYKLASSAEWKSFADVRATFPSTDLVGDKLIFNVGGNSYRIICFARFSGQVMFDKWVGTHAEYDKLDVREL